MSEQAPLIKDLMEKTGKPVPTFFTELSDENLQALHQYTNDVVDHATDGLDELYSGMSMTMKYIPTFMLVKMTTKFIKPAISAGISAKLPLKDALKINPKFPVEYACDVASHLESEYAAKMLKDLKIARTEELMTHMIENHTVKALDIGQYLDKKQLKVLKKFRTKIEAMDSMLLEQYGQVIDNIRNA